jgi:hypothetical protein
MQGLYSPTLPSSLVLSFPVSLSLLPFVIFSNRFLHGHVHDLLPACSLVISHISFPLVLSLPPRAIPFPSCIPSPRAIPFPSCYPLPPRAVPSPRDIPFPSFYPFPLVLTLTPSCYPLPTRAIPSPLAIPSYLPFRHTLGYGFLYRKFRGFYEDGTAFLNVIQTNFLLEIIKLTYTTLISGPI